MEDVRWRADDNENYTKLDDSAIYYVNWVNGVYHFVNETKWEKEKHFDLGISVNSNHFFTIFCFCKIKFYCFFHSANLPSSNPSDAAKSSANPDDDAETVDVVPQAPPTDAGTPDVNGGGEPGIVLIPLQPDYNVYNPYNTVHSGWGVVQQPTLWSYFPFNPYQWNLNYFNGEY